MWIQYVIYHLKQGSAGHIFNGFITTTVRENVSNLSMAAAEEMITILRHLMSVSKNVHKQIYNIIYDTEKKVFIT